MRIRSFLIIIAAIAVQACSNLPPKSNDGAGTAAVIQKPAGVIKKAQPPAVPVLNSIRKAAQAPPPAAVAEQTPKPQYANIWERIRANLTLDRHIDKRQVRAKLAWYRRNQDFLDRTADRAAPYIYYIVEELDKRHMPLDLALLPVIESAYHPFARSPSRASGIWQFIPSTGRIYGLKQNWWYDGRRDVVAATRAALDYLEKLHNHFNGDWLLALAAYNSGELNVSRAIRRNLKRGKKTDFWSLHLPRETRGYVPSLLAVAELVKNPKRYHVRLKPLPNKPYFAQVSFAGQIDLALAANLADMSMDDLYTLNPGFNRWATDPDGPQRLLLPVAKTALFKNRLKNVAKRDRIGWKKHKIRSGESLNLIAHHYNTSVRTLKRINGLHGNLIRVGRSLLIPTSKQPLKYYTLSLTSRRYRGLRKSGANYIYTVKRGDTLWDIGRNYGVSVRSLLAWNRNLTSKRYLHPGQKLHIAVSVNDSSNHEEHHTTKSVIAVSSGNGTQDAIVYTIRSGDSLWTIANRYSVTIHSLLKLNDLTPRTVLHPGQKLTIRLAGTGTYPVSLDGQDSAPVNYTVKEGDSLWLISRHYGTTIKKLRQWNKLPEGKPLQPGQVLVLYIQEV